METMVLKDPGISPSEKVLKNAMGKTCTVYEQLMTMVKAKGCDLVPEWHYYNDGKAWLCKVQYKKKTVFWLSVWSGYFKLTFYFAEKNRKGIGQLDIDPKIKESLAESNAIGKLFPLAIKIREKSQLKDVLRVIDYKKSLI